MHGGDIGERRPEASCKLIKECDDGRQPIRIVRKNIFTTKYDFLKKKHFKRTNYFGKNHFGKIKDCDSRPIKIIRGNTSTTKRYFLNDTL